MEIIENELEIRHIVQAFDNSVRSDVSILVWISGPHGTGKTTMLNFLPTLIGERTRIVRLSASGSRFERTFETGLIGQLLRAAGLPDEVLAYRSLLLSTAPQTGGTEAAHAESGTDTHVVFDQLCDLMLKAAGGSLLVITVDDAQYVDSLSMHFLLHLTRRALQAPIALLVSESAESPFPDQTLRTELLRLPHCQQVRLRPLSRNSLMRLLAPHAPPSLIQDLAAEFQAITGGNQLLVAALIRDSGNALSRGRAAPGQAFGNAVLASLHRYHPEVIQVAQALAVLDEAADAEMAGEMLGLTSHAAERAVDSLCGATLLAGQRFRHDAIRQAVLNGLPAEKHVTLHEAAATVLHNRGFPASVIAEHLVATCGWVPAWGHPVLSEAAADALDADAVDCAVRYLRHAIYTCLDNETQRAAVLAMLCRALWRSDPAAAARRTPELLDAHAAGHLDTSDQMTLIKQLLWEGLQEKALSIARTVPVEHGLATTRDTAALFFAALYPVFTGTALGPHPAQANLAQALRNERITERTLGPILTQILGLIVADEVDEAEARIGLLLAQLTAMAGISVWKALLLSLEAVARIRRANFSGARSSAQAAIDVLDPKGWGVLIGLPLACLIITATRLGLADEAEEHMRHQVPSAMMQTTVGLLYLQARGQYHLAAAEFDAARRDFDACQMVAARLGADVPPLLRWRLDWARLLLRTGDYGKAQSLLLRELLLVPSRYSVTRGSILHLLAQTKPINERLVALRHVARLLSGAPYAQALVYADLGHLRRQLGDRRGAATAARKARSLFAASGARPGIVDLTGREPTDDAATAQRPRLSKAERQVAELAAKGLTNEEIARQLHVTVSTIEQHLTRVYRKLMIRSRGELR